MAEARFIEGEVEQACRIGHDALDVVEQTASDRVRVKLAEVDAIAEHYADAREVAQLRDRIRPLASAKGIATCRESASLGT
jgi:hypothetical protein